MENAETAYALGQAAYEQGRKSSDNPYEAADDRCKAWDDGWEAARAFDRSTKGFEDTSGMGFVRDLYEDDGHPD